MAEPPSPDRSTSPVRPAAVITVPPGLLTEPGVNLWACVRPMLAAAVAAALTED
jgi:hypothetical protein